MQLHDLRAPRGANRKQKRVGRGESSGHGKTAGRGGKGQTARSGKGKPRRGFEGGQMPMFRRMPKRGFHNIFRLHWAEINLERLTRFAAGAEINLTVLQQAGLASKRAEGLRILGRGELGRALTIKADHFTASARQKIEAAGGQAVAAEPAASESSPA